MNSHAFRLAAPFTQPLLHIAGLLLATAAAATAQSCPGHLTVGAGDEFSLALQNDGTIAAWGYNGFGQLGVPALPTGRTYVEVEGSDASHAIARVSDGTVRVWGNTGSGRGSVPALPSGVTYVQVAAGLWHCMARRSDGQVVAWGYNSAGETIVPAPAAGTTYADIAAGWGFSVALQSNGTLRAWGNGTPSVLTVPTAPSGQTFVDVAAGASFGIARTSGGSIVVWGGTSGGVAAVPALPSGVTYTDVDGGRSFVLARRSDGTVVGWGNNSNGQCSPPALPTGVSYIDVAAGGWHGVALRSDGETVAWGYNSWGQRQVPERPACCPGSLVANGYMGDGIVAGSMPTASLSRWSRLTETPQVVPQVGCNGPGCLQMWGNQVVGEAVYQQLGGPAIEAGKTYRLSLNYRYHANPALPNHVRIRVQATAGFPGVYPSLDTSAAVVGVTPNTSSTSWSHYEVTWTAPFACAYLTLNPENDLATNHGSYVSWAQLDDVCLQVVATVSTYGSSCQGTALALTVSAPPQLGELITFQTSGIPAGTLLGAQLLSFSQVNPGQDLGSIGMPGCQRLVSSESTSLFFPVGTNGASPFQVPNDPAFAGLPMFAQSLVMTPGANALGVLSTNGLALVIGQ